jgi:hypothetical protein
MAHPSKARGDRAEREVAAIISGLLGLTVKRALGAGRKEDVGDQFGIPQTVVQVANYTDLVRAVREKLPEAEQQRKNAGAMFAATFVRRYGGSYVVVLTPEQWATYWREAGGVTGWSS